jgi:hypothetical protein
MVAKAERRIVAVPSCKIRRGKVWLGPVSEKGEPRRGRSKVAEGRSLGAAFGLASERTIFGGGISGMDGELVKIPGARVRRASSPKLKPRLRRTRR